MPRRIFKLWIVVTLGALALAQVLFTGEQSSEVAGNLVFALLILCFPSSIVGYPLALAAVAWFESQGLFPYNSRIVLFVWWGIFFGCGVAQWAAILCFFYRRKPNPAFERDAAKARRPSTLR